MTDRTTDATTPLPIQFARFFATLAAIEREKRYERRQQERYIVEVANEIERESPPPPPLMPGVEVMGGYVWIDAGGERQ